MNNYFPYGRLIKGAGEMRYFYPFSLHFSHSVYLEDVEFVCQIASQDHWKGFRVLILVVRCLKLLHFRLTTKISLCWHGVESTETQTSA